MINIFRKRKEREIVTVKTMIRMYCRAHHHPEGEMCEACAEVFSYATMKYHRCLFGEDKPVCEVCPVHCYGREMRERIRTIMRWSGPRMILRHPLMAIDHLMLLRRSKRRMHFYLKKVNLKKHPSRDRKSA